MRRAERIKLALVTLRETRQAVLLTQSVNARTAPGQNFVRVTLVSDIPDENVARGLENVVQRHRQFHNAETGAEMAARPRNRRYRLGAKFVRKRRQRLLVKRAQVGKIRNAVKHN